MKDHDPPYDYLQKLSRRRILRLPAGVLATGLAGCTGTEDEESDSTPMGTDQSEETSTSTPTEEANESGEETDTETQTEETAEFSVTVDYSTHVQDSATGEYDLPEPTRDSWSWLVVDLEVTSGELDMQEVWFRGFFETEERLYAVSHDSEEVENGVESRGTIREGGRGVILHDYPSTPQANLVGWNTSVMRQSVGGTEVVTDGPNELYPPASVEYTVSTATNPSVLPDEHTDRRSERETWAVVSIDVTEGVLNMEDIWFRTRLSTQSRRHELSHASQHAMRGALSRGMVKSGNSVNALYLIGEDEYIQEWGYTEDSRQNVSVSRK